MPDGARTQLFTVPVGESLVDVLAQYLFNAHDGSREALADTLILLPNNRAIKSLTEAFVRHAKGGLLLPQMVAVGDLALDEQLAPIFDPIGHIGAQPIPPAISEIERKILLAGLIRKQRSGVGSVEAMKLARHLATALDALEVEEKGLSDLEKCEIGEELQAHWQAAYGDFMALARLYEAELAKRNRVSAARRRNMLLSRFAETLPTDRPLVAAGITTSAPAVARLLRAVSRLPGAMLIWPNAGLDMAEADWDALGPIRRDGAPDIVEETHPFFHLKQLFDRMAIRRDELEYFPGTMPSASHISAERVFDSPERVMGWSDLANAQKTLPKARVMVCADSAEEALAIAILIRQALEKPERQIALVTPDRELARRVTAQLRRWDIFIDDSAGQPLLDEPSATLLLGLAACFQDCCGPVSLLSVLKHPLAGFGQERLEWLESVRLLDAELRGPRQGIGIGAISDAVRAAIPQGQSQSPLLSWWNSIAGVFAPFEGADALPLPAFIDALSRIAGELSAGRVWLGQAGRHVAQLLEDYAACDLSGIGEVDRNIAPRLLQQLLEGEVVRPAYGSHPRVSLYGLLEARLQQADFVICGGLNEGSWPQLPSPDPWLAPRLRRDLGLPGLERNIGLSAHDLLSLLGSDEIVLSRAERDRAGPTVASRFLLRIQALAGSSLKIEEDAPRLARALDQGLPKIEVEPPSVRPSPTQRKVAVSVTQVDVLRADPFAFYARKILDLPVLAEVDAAPHAAWRGTAIHALLEEWAKSDALAPQKLIERADAMLANPAISPVLRTLWQPRISAALTWLANESVRLQQEEGRRLLGAECWGNTKIAGVTLSAKADRIDSDRDGKLVIIDYKTGSAPAIGKIAAGYALQLGLIGVIAQDGGFERVSGAAGTFEYWTLNKRGDGGFGKIVAPLASQKIADHIRADFTGFAFDAAETAFRQWILGDAPFVAKLNPEFAVGADYDQLARLSEWYGRAPAKGGQ